MAFELNAQLKADTLFVRSLAICELLLMNDSRFPWCVLVPRFENARELHRLSPADRIQVSEEIFQVATVLEELTQAHKMNVAALGNQVPQLHIHIIARKTNDPAWPRPVWGTGSAIPYEINDGQRLVQVLQGAVS